MKKCIVFGNCQVDAIKLFLLKSESFRSMYQIIEAPPVHLTSVELEESLFKDVDLFIYQRVKDTYGAERSTDYILGLLPESCQTISIPNAYFKGYHPQQGPNPTIKPDPRYSNKPSGKFPYGDRNIHKLLDMGMSKDDILRELSRPDFYSTEELISNLEETLLELKSREKGIDVIISDFIESNFRNIRLFYTVNHPHGLLLKELSMRILKNLGIDHSEISELKIDPFSRDLHVPIYPSVIRNLGLTFVDEDSIYSFYINKDDAEINFSDYIIEYLDHATS